MAGNTRGKLKEELEGIHRNLDWVSVHSDKCIMLIQERHPELTGMFVAIRDQSKTMDELLAGVYASI